MKNNGQTKKDAVKSIVYKAFMTSPIPSCITTFTDGKYIDINEACVRYTGMKRKDIIGRRVTELGFISEKRRHLYIDEIKKDGFVRNIPLKLKIDGQAVKAFFAANKFKQGKEDFLVCYIYSFPNHKQHIKISQSDIFYKAALLDLKYIQDILRQYNLTPRQKEITISSATGKSNADIAKELHISEHTVKDHMKEIFHIISINNRRELVPKLLNFI